MNKRTGALTLIAFALALLPGPAVAQSQPLTLAWDANPENSVTGYVVYVGNTSGAYKEEYDVGNVRSFTYRNAVLGRPYFFAVAAYTTAKNIGPVSEEVFFLGGAPTLSRGAIANPVRSDSAHRDAHPSSNTDSRAISYSDAREVICAAAPLDETCYEVVRLAPLAGNVSALTPTSGGRLLFIEGHTRVRIVDGDVLVAGAALSVDSAATQLSSLIVDPGFAQNGFVYVSEMETNAGGSRELRIVRYRELGNVLAEGAVMVAGVPVPAGGDAPFTIDSAGRFYVAVAAAGVNEQRSPYGGMLLRFENDGTASPGNAAGSPVFARGYSEPTSLVWSGRTDALWLTGSDIMSAGPLARLQLGGGTAHSAAAVQPIVGSVANSRIVSVTAREASGVTGESLWPDFVLVDQAGDVFVANEAGDGLAARRRIPTNELHRPVTSVALGASADPSIYLGVARTTESAPSFEIIRLRRR